MSFLLKKNIYLSIIYHSISMILPTIILSVTTVNKTKQIIIFQQTTSLDYYSVCPTGLRKADISPPNYYNSSECLQLHTPVQPAVPPIKIKLPFSNHTHAAPPPNLKVSYDTLIPVEFYTPIFLCMIKDTLTLR
jgi:hypothetical protein